MICKKCKKEIPGLLNYIGHVWACSEIQKSKPKMTEPDKAQPAVLQKAKSAQPVKERTPDELAQSIGITIPELPDLIVAKRLELSLPSYIKEKLFLCERQRKFPKMSCNVSSLFALKYGKEWWRFEEKDLAFELNNEICPTTNDGYFKLDILFSLFQEPNFELKKIKQDPGVLELTWHLPEEQKRKDLKITRIVQLVLHLEKKVAEITHFKQLEFCLNVKSQKLEDLAIKIQASGKSDFEWFGRIFVNQHQLAVSRRLMMTDSGRVFDFEPEYEFDCSAFARNVLLCGGFKNLAFSYDADGQVYLVKGSFEDSFTNHSIKIIFDEDLSKAYFKEYLRNENAEY